MSLLVRSTQAVMTQQVGLNIITELIIGYAIPDHPIAIRFFKTWNHTAIHLRTLGSSARVRGDKWVEMCAT